MEVFEKPEETKPIRLHLKIYGRNEEGHYVTFRLAARITQRQAAKLERATQGKSLPIPTQVRKKIAAYGPIDQVSELIIEYASNLRSKFYVEGAHREGSSLGCNYLTPYIHDQNSWGIFARNRLAMPIRTVTQNGGRYVDTSAARSRETMEEVPLHEYDRVIRLEGKKFVVLADSQDTIPLPPRKSFANKVLGLFNLEMR